MADELNVATAPETQVATPAPETPAQDTGAPAEPVTRRDMLAQQFEKKAQEQSQQAGTPPPNNRGRHAAFQQRQDAGRFAPGPVKPPVGQQAAADIPFPKSFKKQYEQHWGAVPAEFRAEIVRRNQEFDTAHQTLKQQAEQAKELFDAIKPYGNLLERQGLTPAAAVGALLRSAAVLTHGSPAEKSQAMARLFHDYGVPFDSVAQILRSAQGVRPPADPAYSQLAQQVSQITQHLNQQYQQASEQADQRSLSVIQQFKQDPAHAHFDAVADRITVLLGTPGILGDISALSDKEKLQLAYDTAVRMDPELSKQALQQQVQQRTDVANARRAAVSVTGAPGTASAGAPDPKNRREYLRYQIESLQP